LEVGASCGIENIKEIKIMGEGTYFITRLIVVLVACALVGFGIGHLGLSEPLGIITCFIAGGFTAVSIMIIWSRCFKRKDN
jgi:hypothetical protein